MRRPTITDVARRAGVSTAAVSFAVNDRPGVAEATRARILAAADELGWRPSARARALTESRSRAIGLVLFREPRQLEADAFFVRFLAGIEQTLAVADYALLLQLLAPGDVESARESYERLAAGGRVDGVLLCDLEADEDPRFGFLQARGVPVVVAGRPPADTPLPWLETDHAQGIAVAVDHLLALGHRRIGFLGGPAALEHVVARQKRWAGRLAAAGAPRGPEASAASAMEGGPEIAGLLDAEPTAVVCTSDPLALAVIAAARARGLDVPGQLSVTGFDDSSLALFAEPALTSVHVDYVDFGAAAAAALLAVIAGNEPARWRGARPELRVRASTAAPPAR